MRCADDAELMALANEIPTGQPPNHQFFGAVHFLVLSNPADAFVRYFSADAKADDKTFAALKDFCRRRRDELLTILRSRTVQFTMLGRANLVLPLLGHVLRKGAKEPLSLIEVGASAGLLTAFDHYYYDFGALGRLGDPNAPQVAVAKFEGNTPPIPTRMPKIADRVGIDLNPIDPADPIETRWLEALLPPDMEKERLELRQALALRATIPIKTMRGDAMVMVPEAMQSMRDPVCIMHCNCLYQWPAPLQRKFHEMLLAESRSRDIYRVGVDMIYENPARPTKEMPSAAEVLVMDITSVTYRKGEAQWEYLGRADTWARRARWMA